MLAVWCAGTLKGGLELGGSRIAGVRLQGRQAWTWEPILEAVEHHGEAVRGQYDFVYKFPTSAPMSPSSKQTAVGGLVAPAAYLIVMCDFSEQQLSTPVIPDVFIPRTA